MFVRPRGPEQGGVSEFVLSGSYTGVVLLLFSFTTFLRNAGERDLVRDHGALAVAQLLGGSPLRTAFRFRSSPESAVGLRISDSSSANLSWAQLD